MTTITFRRDPRPAHAGPGIFARGFRVTKNALRATMALTLTPHKASLKRLAEMPLTVMAAGAFDWAGFHLGSGWGLAVTGLSLVIVEHLISDDDQSSRRQ